MMKVMRRSARSGVMRLTCRPLRIRLHSAAHHIGRRELLLKASRHYGRPTTSSATTEMLWMLLLLVEHHAAVDVRADAPPPPAGSGDAEVVSLLRLLLKMSVR